MDANINDDEEVAYQGALEWSHDVQRRFASERAVGLAEVSARAASPTPRQALHMEQVRAAMAEIAGDAAALPSEPAKRSSRRSPYDEPWAREALERAFDRLETGLDALERPKIAKLLLSTLPSGQISAFCAQTTWSDYKFIFVDAELLTMAGLAAKVIAICLQPMVDQDNRLTRVDSRKPVEVAKTDIEVAARLADIYGAIILRGSARAAEPWVPRTGYFASMVLTRAMELFVVAHEVAHVSCGHFEKAQSFEASVLDQNSSALAFSHIDEFEADGVGLMLTLAVAAKEGDSSVMPFLAPYVFLKTIALLYDCQKVFGISTGDASTHPDPSDRAARIRSLAILLSDRRRPVDKVLTRVDQIFFQLSRRVLPLMEAAKAAGLKPASRRGIGDPMLERPQILGITAMHKIVPTPIMATLHTRLDAMNPPAEVKKT